MKLNKILVPLDGSALAEAALPKAVELAQAGGAELLLLRAVQASSLPGVDPTEAQVKVVREAEEYLVGIAERVATAGVKDVTRSVWYGPAAHSIAEAARLYKVDLIVMTTHGRSGLGRLVLGSVAESVLRGTQTPILLLRGPEAPVDLPKNEDAAAPRPEPTHV